MSRTRSFQDHNFLVWEVYATGGPHGFSDDPNIVFNCLTQPKLRSRVMNIGEDEADAQRIVAEATPAKLLDLFEKAREIT